MSAQAHTDADDIGKCGSHASKHVANMWDKLETVTVTVTVVTKLIYNH